MHRYNLLIRTIWKLGFLNVITVIIHRLKLKTGFYALREDNALDRIEPLFVLKQEIKQLLANQHPILNCCDKEAILEANNLLEGNIRLFFYQPYKTTSPPGWFHFAENSTKVHFSKQKINATPGHDIKLTWDLSRFQWLMVFARAFKLTQQNKYLVAMNSWCMDWLENNPVNYSVNWSCGQECAIRLINTLNATHLLSTDLKSFTGLQSLVIAHLKRIEKTINYSIAQDNNHGTSEAAGLYIGAAWLESQFELHSDNMYLAKRLKKRGQKLLENRIKKLVGDDGGFSMSSTNYHRVVLNTVAIVEFWRKKLNLDQFPEVYLQKCRAMCQWLFKLTDETTGLAPNMGANDGSNPFIMQLTLDYRDYRPSIQFAMYHFFNALAYPSDSLIDESLHCFSLSTSNYNVLPQPKITEVLENSGIVIFKPLDNNHTHAFLKFPVSSFRPYQADMFHFDLWIKGINVISDAGSYSYNAKDENIQDYFCSIKAHNTIQIDEKEPMIKLSPFLMGNWPEMIPDHGLRKRNNVLVWQGSFNWPCGAVHQREIYYDTCKWVVKDNVTGAKKNITLRWRLPEAPWALKDLTVSHAEWSLSIREQNNQLIHVSIEDSLISNYYNNFQNTSLLLARIESQEANFVTEISI